MRGSLGEREMLCQHELQASVSTAFLSSPKLSRVFVINSIEHQYKYHSKVGCHPTSCFSRDKTLISRDKTPVSRGPPLKCIHVFSIGINYKQLASEKMMNFSRRGEACPVKESGFSGSCFTCRFKRTILDLQAKSLNGKDEI